MDVKTMLCAYWIASVPVPINVPTKKLLLIANFFRKFDHFSKFVFFVDTFFKHNFDFILQT